MGIRFPTAEWTSAFKDAINANAAYAEAGSEWTHGSVAYVVAARPDLGLPEERAMLLDLHRGSCRDAQLVDAAQAQEADFVIRAEYEEWREVLSGEVDPTKAMMQNRLRLEKGHLPTLVKFVVASRELVRSAATIDTEYPA
ncbi:MAG: SCP2 sterol-binding domain-containing protein [Sandaracinaceae bacterium]